MRRRLDLAATLVATPEVLFLDEPTTGLDPRARNELWEVLDTLVQSGVTILLTTQYLEEAERLADHILVVDHGRVIAAGSARELKRRIGGEQIRAVLRGRRGAGRRGHRGRRALPAPAHARRGLPGAHGAHRGRGRGRG